MSRMRSAYRLFELGAIWSIGLGCMILAGYMVYLGRMGEAFGSVLGILPLCLNRISNLGQSQVMNAMAEHLAASTPAPKDDTA